jgi:DNA (cytosine-5)-methyltransferase 1
LLLYPESEEDGMKPLTVGSLFSGIGGFELGLERTGGFKTVWQCEIDPFCLKVLEKHWPGVKRFADIKKMGIGEEIPYVDVICGGFPCQPVSCAGKRKGKEDTRWLWPEFCRVVRCVRPEWVLIENVPGLLSADSGRLFAGILRDLSESGYDAEWNIVSAASVGAPHLRKRVFIVAKMVHPLYGGYIHQESSTSPLQDSDRQENRLPGKASPDVADADQIRRRGRAGMFWQGRGRESQDGGAELPDPKGERLEGRAASKHQEQKGGMRFLFARQSEQIGGGQWAVEPDVGRVANGVPARVDRLRALGNAIVPQCAQFVGQCLLDSTRTEAAQ